MLYDDSDALTNTSRTKENVGTQLQQSKRKSEREKKERKRERERERERETPDEKVRRE